jgi:hypothetical protein
MIYTARGMKSSGGNLGMIMVRNAKTVIDTLDRFSIPYDEIYFGKPYADV